jgi:hypothetical protein
MIVQRRTWFYRLAGETFAHSIYFKIPVTAAKVREELRRAFSATTVELWAR